MNNKIVILGAGAVGSTLGAALEEKYSGSVTLIGRKSHVDKIISDGLSIEGDVSKNLKISAKTKIDFSLENTLLIISTKITTLPGAIEEILPFVTDTTTILLIQNGYGAKDIAIEAINGKISENNVYQSIISMGVVFREPGIIDFWGGGIKVEKPFTETDYSEIFKDTFIDFKATRNIGHAIWYKLVINSVVNPLSVILKAKNKVIAETQYNDLKEKILNECIAVAKSEGFDTSMTVEQFNSYISNDNYTSMLQDYFYKRNNEIDLINGVIIRFGEKNGLDVSMNKLIFDLVKSIEKVNLEGKSISNIQG
ncbi:MAG: 2-dehydropantoate 2-reductase [Candidatus Delongbacteria bacterium]|nr:2-dehydropantoate 2-reductase [Candidatus Delongbacteria bacterium]